MPCIDKPEQTWPIPVPPRSLATRPRFILSLRLSPLARFLFSARAPQTLLPLLPPRRFTTSYDVVSPPLLDGGGRFRVHNAAKQSRG